MQVSDIAKMKEMEKNNAADDKRDARHNNVLVLNHFIKVPKTGFEPARRFQRYHLKVVRLPISPPGHFFKHLSCKKKEGVQM